MADVTIPVILNDVDIPVASPAYLRYRPMPQILDPTWVKGVDPEPQPMVDQFASLKLLIAFHCEQLILTSVNRGIDLLDKDAAVYLTEDMFVH